MNTKLLSCIVIILAVVQTTVTAPTVSTTEATVETTTETKSNTDLLSNIEKFQQKYREKIAETKGTTIDSRQDNFVAQGQLNHFPSAPSGGGHRQDKMLGYFGYYPQPIAPMPTPFYPQPNYYDDYGQVEEEDIMSRANRRRPQNNGQFENSPIFYIRLPPTPYMFVPGLGYISQPPTISPMNALAPMNPMAHMQPNPTAAPLGLNPFINLPLNFVSNGKPTNIYQWGSNPAFQQNQAFQPNPTFQPTPAFQPNPAYQPNPYSQFGYPQRPVRPSYKPKPQFLAQDSKIHHLKGQFLFNGRPDDIYVLGNSYNSLYQEPMQSYY